MLQSTSSRSQHSDRTAFRLPQLHRSHLVSGLVGAGIAAILVILLTLDPNSTPALHSEDAQSTVPHQPLASFFSGLNAVIAGKAALGNDSFEEGELALDRGIAHLAFRNGAQIVLEGQCGFEIIDENTVVLSHGKLWAHCPMEARGFEVLTPEGLKIIDLGTEFGVEVDRSGHASVHVFDGLVDVVEAGTTPRRIEAGGAVTWEPNTTITNLDQADPDKFVTVSTLAQKRMKAHHTRMLARTDLLLYYDFSDFSDGLVRNIIPGAAASTHGRISGASAVAGRNPNTNALQFEHRGDAIALELIRPKEIQSFTTALWVKVDRLESPLATLLNSNGWDLSDIHFQLTRSGTLKTGINGGVSYESSSGHLRPGSWQLLTASWDLETRTARLSCDGKPLPVEQAANSRPRLTLDPQLGQCQIGSWNPLPSGNPNDVRDFKGRIDEVMIFNHALTEEEIAALYTAGRP